MPQQTSSNSRIIKASPKQLYQALTDPGALEIWQVPDNMQGKVHRFDLNVGGGYEMSLFYPESDKDVKGKTAKLEDRFLVKFLELEPNQKIVEAAVFVTDDPGFAGTMTIEISLDPVAEGTMVTFFFKDIPPGIGPEDNEAGTAQSLEKLERYVTGW